MKIIDDVRAHRATNEKSVLTIGSFDGVHRGHQHILEQLIDTARNLDATPTILTLRPHPREFFSPMNAPNILTEDTQKFRLFEKAGVQTVFILPFNEQTANLDRENFLNDIILNRCAAKALVIGHDFAFGKDALGNYEYLNAVQKQYNFQVTEVAPLVLQGERVSSTLIREGILQGELDKVETFLGRKYTLMGEVVSGRGLGVKSGFPTANIKPKNKSIPNHGVYVARAKVGHESYPAAVNIGIAPTIRHKDIRIEAHILDFDQDITGNIIEIEFHKCLRPEKKFPSIEALLEAIREDVRAVREHFQD